MKMMRFSSRRRRLLRYFLIVATILSIPYFLRSRVFIGTSPSKKDDTTDFNTFISDFISVQKLPDILYKKQGDLIGIKMSRNRPKHTAGIETNDVFAAMSKDMAKYTLSKDSPDGRKSSPVDYEQSRSNQTTSSPKRYRGTPKTFVNNVVLDVNEAHITSDNERTKKENSERMAVQLRNTDYNLNLGKRANSITTIYDLFDVPQMKQYCNSPFQEVVGDEGSSIKGLSLQMVQVLIRHGDRASVHHLNNFRSPDINCNFGHLTFANDSKVNRFVHTMKKNIGRQPDNSYFLNWALFPDRNICGPSDMTPLGAMQSINLGSFLFSRYNLSGLFNYATDISKYILTFSTGSARTYQSAIAFLFGLLPTFNLKDLDIRFASNPYFCSEKYSLKTNCVCKHASELLAKSNIITSNGNSKSARYSSIKQSISKLFQAPWKKIPWVSGILDSLAPSICHKLEVPCSSSDPSQCVNVSLLTDIWEELMQSHRQVLTDLQMNHLQFSSIMMFPLMAEVTGRMVRKAEGKEAPKFVLYSGHDLTLTPLLHVLDLYDGTWPPYASRLVLELYRSDGKPDSSEDLVRILYNGRDITHKVTFCRISQQSKRLCSLKQFALFVYTKMMQRFGFVNFPEACSKIYRK